MSREKRKKKIPRLLRACNRERTLSASWNKIIKRQRDTKVSLPRDISRRYIRQKKQRKNGIDFFFLEKTGQRQQNVVPLNVVVKTKDIYIYVRKRAEETFLRKTSQEAGLRAWIYRKIKEAREERSIAKRGQVLAGSCFPSRSSSIGKAAKSSKSLSRGLKF